MIHVFQGCRDICALPSKICEGCAKLCGDVDCGPCDRFCEGFCDTFRSFANRPLGVFVVAGVALSAFEVVTCLVALIDEENEGAVAPQVCAFPEGFGRSVGLRVWLLVQFGCACLNLMFAPYIQHQLARNLQEQANGQALESGSTDSAQQVPKGEVRRAFSKVFWEDIGVCVYVFALVGSLVWSFYGLQWIKADSLQADVCNENGHPLQAARLGAFYPFFVAGSFAVFHAYLECMSTVEVTPARYLLPGHAAAVTQHGGQAPFFDRAGGHGSAQGVAPPASGKRSCLRRALTAQQLSKLAACLCLDAFGDASYLIPGLGEGIDLAYAPAQAVALKMIFQSNAIALLAVAEELLPFTDIFPTATFAWVLDCFGVFDVAAPPPTDGHAPLPPGGVVQGVPAFPTPGGQHR